ncbi:hypothetical protein BCR44DRAFT_382944 [Catenaria anguillulae PL171]|uniref:Uncharacterized protein n=1 Tax=Catenaria anguillulae PL171 TaxID=765915 RepID=A0A1Y2HFS5_9FUNG|nr:hypothetical protein BCR44DRAFT_382944 [Catenaria anguillulae PL171]
MIYFVVRFVLPFPFPFWPCVSFLLYPVPTQSLLSHSVPIHWRVSFPFQCLSFQRFLMVCQFISSSVESPFFGLSQPLYTFSHRLLLSNLVIFGQVLSLHVLLLLDL